MRSVLSIGAGLVAMMVVVMAGTAAATAAFVPGGIAGAMQKPADGVAPPLPGSYLTANLLVSLAAAILGGWVASRFAPFHPQTHVYVLTLVAGLLAVPSAIKAGSMGQPSWYGWVIAVVGIAGVLIGGWVEGASKRAS
jgi:hypothetical protein